ncbi:hypothetical protein BASA81_007799 [Batrachochytrium salamandrivorans]|nr:hypothetical protein BASA81_007799 [Batrachochytrium salamandrivorans]
MSDHEDLFNDSPEHQQQQQPEEEGSGEAGGEYTPSTFVKDSVTGLPISQTSRSITVKLEDQDLAFVLGYHGQTKLKIAKVSNTRLDVDERAFSLTISGSIKQRLRAQEYTDMVLGQRRGTVSIDLSQERDDLTILHVPEDCVGYVTGRKGIALRHLEEEWGTLMFFCNALNPPAPPPSAEGLKTEILAIFGPRRGRLGSALKVMSAVEQKRKDYFLDAHGHYVGDLAKDMDSFDEGIYYEQILLDEPDFRYALGTKGATRKKLAKASGCILEYVGFAAVMVGTKPERGRVQDYLKWLLLQRQNNTKRCEVDVEHRTDVRVLELEAKYVGWVTGMKGKNLRQIEDETGVYLFCHNGRGEQHPSLTSTELERILIFSHDKRSRDRAYEKIARSIHDKKEADAGRGGSRFGNERYGGGGGGGGGDRRGGGGGDDDRYARDERRGSGGSRRRSRTPRSPPPRRREESGGGDRDHSRRSPSRRQYNRDSHSPPPRRRGGDEGSSRSRREGDYPSQSQQQSSSSSSRRRSRDRH